MTTEPWLSGAHAHLHPIPRLLACSLEQSLRELEMWTAHLDETQLWAAPQALGPIGFHLRHIAGSAERLFTYARGEALTEEQLHYLQSEHRDGATPAELLAHARKVFDGITTALDQFTPSQMHEPRYIGRKRFEAPLGVLLAHIAEHTQRHTGQVILLSKLLGA